MASSLKNISALLSPSVLSPLSPSRKLLLFASKSEGRLFFQQIKRKNIAKRLDFSESSKLSTFSKPTSVTNLLPDIKIEIAPEDTQTDLETIENTHFLAKSTHTLDINTPNKSELAKNGLSNFKNSTWVLGKGTFGTVFKGKQKGKLVAVKIVSKEDGCREKNALNLIHINIIRTLEIIRDLEHRKYSLIVMEYIENCKNLQEILDNFQANNANSSNYNRTKWLKNCCLDVTNGLDFCHKNGVLHLDLKPKNILVNSENVCKICDFGNSVKIGDNLDSFKHNGTVVYTAPEILFGKMPSKKSDIYSLGLIFWQIKYQKTPFQSYDSNESIIYNVGKHNIRPAYKDESSDRLTNIFTKCWASDPDLRPDTEDILKDLKSVTF